MFLIATVYSFVFTEGPFQGTQVTKVTGRPGLLYSSVVLVIDFNFSYS